MPLLDVEKLDVTYATRHRPPLHAVRNVTFAVGEGEFVGLVGESGSGKSTLGNAILRLLQPPGVITAGSVRFDGKDITRVPEEQLRPMRWRDFSTVFQSSMNALNPVTRIEAQFRDVMEEKTDLGKDQIRERIAELLRMVKIDPSFISGLGQDPVLTMLTKTIVQVGRDLGMQVIAEGIEQPRQLAELREMGCGFGQGFLVARPMAAPGVESLIRTGTIEPGGAPAPDVNGTAKPGVPAA